MFELKFTNSCIHDFAKISRDAQLIIQKEYLLLLQTNPYIGKILKGKKYNGYYKLKAKFKETEYRIIYRINGEELIVLLILIASRENVYKKLDRRI